jgi:hypothetical protein
VSCGRFSLLAGTVVRCYLRRSRAHASSSIKLCHRAAPPCCHGVARGGRCRASSICSRGGRRTRSYAFRTLVASAASPSTMICMRPSFYWPTMWRRGREIRELCSGRAVGDGLRSFWNLCSPWQFLGGGIVWLLISSVKRLASPFSAAAVARDFSSCWRRSTCTWACLTLMLSQVAEPQR